MAGARVSTQLLVPKSGVRALAPASRQRFGGARLRRGERRLHPRGVGQLLDISAEVFVERFALYVGIASIFWLPFQVGFELVLVSQLKMLGILWGFMAIFPQLLTTSVVCSLVGGAFLEEEIGLGEALRVVLVRLVGVGVIATLTAMASLALACPCIVTAFLGTWLFGVAPAAYILERETTFSATRRARAGVGVWSGRVADVFRAMARSVRLVWGWGNFGRWIGWAIVVWLITSPFSGVIEGLRQPAARAWMAQKLSLDGIALEVVLALLGALFMGIGTAYAAVVMTMYYLDTRVRREGLDLRLELERVRSASRMAAAGEGAPVA